MLLEGLSDDGYSGVNGVRDNENEGFGAYGRDAGGEIPDNRSIFLSDISVSTTIGREGIASTWNKSSLWLSPPYLERLYIFNDIMKPLPCHLVVGASRSAQRLEEINNKIRTPGLRGKPAGMTTTSAPFNVLARPSLSGKYPSTLAGVEMCERSAATPGVATIS